MWHRRITLRLDSARRRPPARRSGCARPSSTAARTRAASTSTRRVGLGIQRLAVIDLDTRRPADLQRGRLGRRRLQRRDLQLPRAARASCGRAATRFATQGDTEVIVHLYEEHGDRLRRAAARHVRLRALGRAAASGCCSPATGVGKKPLLYAQRDGDAELRLRAGGAARGPGRSRARSTSTRSTATSTYGYVPDPLSAFASVRKLPPAHTLVVRGRPGSTLQPLLAAGLRAQARRRRVRGAAASAIREAICARRRAGGMVADVPLGAFLSGGIDSSAVVAAMAEASPRAGADVLDRLRQRGASTSCRTPAAVAERFGTEHQEFTSRADAVEVLPRIVRHYGEPFADSVGDPELLPRRADPPARHRRAQRRRRRRGVRRLHALRRQRAGRAARPACPRRCARAAAARRRPPARRRRRRQPRQPRPPAGRAMALDAPAALRAARSSIFDDARARGALHAASSAARAAAERRRSPRPWAAASGHARRST